MFSNRRPVAEVEHRGDGYRHYVTLKIAEWSHFKTLGEVLPSCLIRHAKAKRVA